jgi:hypothetical protein
MSSRRFPPGRIESLWQQGQINKTLIFVCYPVIMVRSRSSGRFEGPGLKFR